MTSSKLTRKQRAALVEFGTLSVVCAAAPLWIVNKQQRSRVGGSPAKYTSLDDWMNPACQRGRADGFREAMMYINSLLPASYSCRNRELSSRHVLEDLRWSGTSPCDDDEY